jgi:lipoate-protein ligase A
LKRAEYKVPGGKLLAAEVEEHGGVLVKVKLVGDFFMHPEESILGLEETLTGSPLDEIDERAESFFSDEDITLYGVAPGDFIKVIRLALAS